MIKQGQPPSLKSIAERSNYNHALGYLRAFVIVLVVAHHAMLAYHPFGPKAPASLAASPRWWQAFPVVDEQKWGLAYFLVDFNDRFFMSLMFFLSGLFVWQGLERKGTGAYLRDRLLRLGFPFLVAASVFAPIAYYPTYLQIADHAGIAGFWRQWLSLGQWPAGPAWFLWVLLAFDCLAAPLFAMMPKLVEALGRIASAGYRLPIACFVATAAVSIAAYLPLALLFTTQHWTALGPFYFQTSRILLYLSYFLFGVAVGAHGLNRGMLAPEGTLARHWIWWATGALGAFAAASAVSIATLTSHKTALGWQSASDIGFVLSCAASSFAFIGLYVRFVKSRSRLLDSLSANSYTIYLVHYVFVSWLQFSLLGAALPPPAKFALVFAGALGLSWSLGSAIRRIPAVASVV
jgi:peptidoglycan/LPS O-acetylase OafA/YrhL